MSVHAAGLTHQPETLIARLERLPITATLIWTRIVVGTATFFDGYTTLAIAFALPVLSRQWHLTPAEIGWIISSGYIGQIFGALICSWLAERVGRLKVLTGTIVVYTIMSLLCIFAWSPASLMLFRFIQGLGTGGEVPVASAYINEFASAQKRGRFFLLYEVLFVVGLVFASLLGYFLVPRLGWHAMFYVGLLPAVLTLPMRFFLPESPRWLISHGRLDQAEAVVSRMERDCEASGTILPPPAAAPQRHVVVTSAFSGWGELFSPLYRGRTLMVWSLWFTAYIVNNGLVTWLPTLYVRIFHVPLQTSLGYGFFTNGFGLLTSIACALLIDRVGRRRWYISAFFIGVVPLVCLFALGAKSPVEVLVLATLTYGTIQTVTYSLYLYTAELYPTRIRALGSGTGSAWLRIGSSVGPLVVAQVMGLGGINWVFIVFAGILALGGMICAAFAIETRRQVLEDLSP
ncbi:MAG TPA: MFS transporter [Stellaceae bacterium]|nr:MFS transporter [Stellaceae bacterium]